MLLQNILRTFGVDYHFNSMNIIKTGNNMFIFDFLCLTSIIIHSLSATYSRPTIKNVEQNRYYCLPSHRNSFVNKMYLIYLFDFPTKYMYTRNILTKHT